MDRSLLTRPVVIPWGMNSLGMLQVLFLFSPVIIDPDRTADNVTRGISALAAFTVAAMDIWWRQAGSEALWWKRALFPLMGGTIVYLPGWIVGLIALSFEIVLLVKSR